jgi:hypothetical protein
MFYLYLFSTKSRWQQCLLARNRFQNTHAQDFRLPESRKTVRLWCESGATGA